MATIGDYKTALVRQSRRKDVAMKSKLRPLTVFGITILTHSIIRRHCGQRMLRVIARIDRAAIYLDSGIGEEDALQCEKCGYIERD